MVRLVHMAARKTLLTFSSLKSYDACPRQYYLGYALGYRTRHPAEPLVFGTLIHKCLEAYWRARQRHPNATDKELWAQACVAALEAEYMAGVFGAPTTAPAKIGRARATAMLIAYRAVWDTVECTVLGVEVAFHAPLMHPETHAVSERFERGGKIDAVVRLADNRTALIEHKCLAGSARIYDHTTGTYERADDLFRRGTAPVVTGVNEEGVLQTARALPLREATIRAIFNVTTLGGRSLRVSGNHPVLTPGGWVNADRLVAGDWVATPRTMRSSASGAAMSGDERRSDPSHWLHDRRRGDV